MELLNFWTTKQQNGTPKIQAAIKEAHFKTLLMELIRLMKPFENVKFKRKVTSSFKYRVQ